MRSATYVCRMIFAVILVCLLSVLVQAQEFDLLISNGHMIDPKNRINGKREVAIADGKIARVAQDIPATQAKKVVDADGLYVTPGLIDMHTHIFWGTEEGGSHDFVPGKGEIWWGYSNSYGSVQPDAFSFRSGVTTMVDAGGAGWRDFHQFKEQTVKHSHTRVLAFLNIVGSGMQGGSVEQNLNDMDAKTAARVARQYSDIIVGIKLAHYEGPEWEPTDRAVEASRLADMPVMIDFGRSTPELSLEELFTEHLRSGDIFTHCYANIQGRTSVVDEEGKVRPFVFEAQRKGIIFDVGHGAGSFLFSQAIPAIEQGFKPNTISTDLHAFSMNAGMKDMTNVMSKFLNLGMSLGEVIECATWNSARVIKREDLGHLSVGAEADVAVLNVREGDFGFVDVKGGKLMGTQKLEAELTLRAGRVVWDLNGICSDRVVLNEGRIPVVYALEQNYPNPFNPETTIRYGLPVSATVRLSLCNMFGQLIGTLVDGEHSPGTYSVVWDGTDDTGRAVASGVYLCRMEAGKFSAMRKLMFVR